MNDFLTAAIQLHQFIMQHHSDGSAIRGPDPVGKINWRLTRFIRSYLPFIPWRDQYVFLQGQGYWIRSNLRLGALTGEVSYLEIARQSADFVIEIQRPDGAWNYPLPERSHLLATMEGLWASLGLLAAYCQFRDSLYLEAALNWYDFQIEEIGFSKYRDALAINYYDKPTGLVPNNTTILLWFMIELHQVTGDSQYLKYTNGLMRFLEYSQMESGELEYAFQTRPHFMCYQYNSYQFLDLANYYQVAHDERVRQMLNKMAAYLATGVTERGSGRYDCFKEVPEVDYWTAALAAALRKAHELGLGDYLSLSEQAFGYLLTKQRPDGSFGFSEYSYGLLRDGRSYPRPLAMILSHLLYRAKADERDTLSVDEASPATVLSLAGTQREN